MWCLQDKSDHVWGEVFCLNSSEQVLNCQQKLSCRSIKQVQDKTWQSVVILCSSEILPGKVRDEPPQISIDMTTPHAMSHGLLRLLESFLDTGWIAPLVCDFRPLISPLINMWTPSPHRGPHTPFVVERFLHIHDFLTDTG